MGLKLKVLLLMKIIKKTENTLLKLIYEYLLNVNF